MCHRPETRCPRPTQSFSRPVARQGEWVVKRVDDVGLPFFAGGFFANLGTDRASVMLAAEEIVWVTVRQRVV
jgi:hypothetical protein